MIGEKSVSKVSLMQNSWEAQFLLICDLNPSGLKEQQVCGLSASWKNEGCDTGAVRSVCSLSYSWTQADKSHNSETDAVMDHFLNGEKTDWRIVGIDCLSLEVLASLLLTFHWLEDTGTV